jgi:hypothetical protein
MENETTGDTASSIDVTEIQSNSIRQTPAPSNNDFTSHSTAMVQDVFDSQEVRFPFHEQHNQG